MKKFIYLCLSLCLFASCRETSPVLSLSGEWQFALDSLDVGITEKWFERSFADKIQLPGITPLVEVVDNFVNNRRLSNLFEVKVGNGKLLLCSMDLLSGWKQRPEARQLYYSLLEYMKGDAFNPSNAIESDRLFRLLTEKTVGKASRPEDIY